MTAPSSRLERSQRAQSAVSLPTNFTPSIPHPHPHALKSRSMSYAPRDSYFPTLYNSRGFDSQEDPFETLVGAGADPASTRRQKTGLKESATYTSKRKASYRVEETDGLWARFGASAASLGGWTDGDDRVHEWSTRLGGLDGSDGFEHDHGDSDSEDDGTESRDSKHTATRPQVGRHQSSLSVYHDSFEEAQDETSILSNSSQTSSFTFSPLTTPLTSPAMSRAHSGATARSSLSSLSSSSSTPLPTISPSQSNRLESTGSNDGGLVDALAASFLRTEQGGVFARVESWLEWPWGAAASTSESQVSSKAPTETLSRTSSMSSLGSSSPQTPSVWGGSSELSALGRERSMADLASKLEWDQDERESGDDVGLEGGGLAAFVDIMAGLGGFL